MWQYELGSFFEQHIRVSERGSSYSRIFESTYGTPKIPLDDDYSAVSNGISRRLTLLHLGHRQTQTNALSFLGPR
jgi:hypothetical protein